jgi:hypothetical protein
MTWAVALLLGLASAFGVLRWRYTQALRPLRAHGIDVRAHATLAGFLFLALAIACWGEPPWAAAAVSLFLAVQAPVWLLANGALGVELRRRHRVGGTWQLRRCRWGARSDTGDPAFDEVVQVVGRLEDALPHLVGKRRMQVRRFVEAGGEFRDGSLVVRFGWPFVRPSRLRDTATLLVGVSLTRQADDLVDVVFDEPDPAVRLRAARLCCTPDTAGAYAVSRILQRAAIPLEAAAVALAVGTQPAEVAVAALHWFRQPKEPAEDAAALDVLLQTPATLPEHDDILRLLRARLRPAAAGRVAAVTDGGGLSQAEPQGAISQAVASSSTVGSRAGT